MAEGEIDGALRPEAGLGQNLGGLMKGRKALLAMRLHAAQRVRMLLGLFVSRDGAETDRFRQPRRGCLRIHLRLRNGSDLQLSRAMTENVEHEYRCDRDDGSD